MSLVTDRQFEQISRIAREEWGLHLTEKKVPLISNRLSKFLRRTEFEDVDAYLSHLADNPSEDDMLLFFDLLSTNVTSFFREIQHFHFLERELWTPLARGNLTRAGKRIRIWSAACSTGPEPYSLAIQALQLMPDLGSWDFKILGTDLAGSALETAKGATYPEAMVEKLEPSTVREYFVRNGDETVTVKPEVRELVTIRRHNLMDPLPVKGPFDAIFLRNVMIYFDKPTREAIVQRLQRVLGPRGILAIGSAETLSGLDTELKMAQPAVYIKENG